MRNIDACLYVRPSDRTTLERLVADGKTAQKIVARARIVLLSGRGFGTNSIQREARVSKPTVWRWQKAYMDGGVERLLKDRGKGARAGKKPISAEVRLAIVKRTAQEKPKHATPRRMGSPAARFPERPRPAEIPPRSPTIRPRTSRNWSGCKPSSFNRRRKPWASR